MSCSCCNEISRGIQKTDCKSCRLGDTYLKKLAHRAAVCLLAMANVLRVTRCAPRPRMFKTAVCVPVCSSVTHSCFPEIIGSHRKNRQTLRSELLALVLL